MPLSQRSQLLCCSLGFLQTFSDQHRHYWRHLIAKKGDVDNRVQEANTARRLHSCLPDTSLASWMPCLSLVLKRRGCIERRRHLLYSSFCCLPRLLPWFFFSKPSRPWVLLTPCWGFFFFLPLKLQVRNHQTSAMYCSPPQIKTVWIESWNNLYDSHGYKRTSTLAYASTYISVVVHTPWAGNYSWSQIFWPIRKSEWVRLAAVVLKVVLSMGLTLAWNGTAYT